MYECTKPPGQKETDINVCCPKEQCVGEIIKRVPAAEALNKTQKTQLKMEEGVDGK